MLVAEASHCTEAGVPVIAQIVPQTITTGTSDATVEVVGTNFTNQTVVLWNGGEVATTVVNDTTLAGTVAASSLAVPGTAQLQLQNNITGQRSASMPIKITSPVATTPLTMTTTSLPSTAVGAPYNVTLAATGGDAQLHMEAHLRPYAQRPRLVILYRDTLRHTHGGRQLFTGHHGQ